MIIIDELVLGPGCPKKMFQLYGQCYGFARNSETNTPDDKNCNWQSDDPYFQVAEIEDNPLALNSLKDLMTYKKLQDYVVMTKTASSVSIGKFLALRAIFNDLSFVIF